MKKFFIILLLCSFSLGLGATVLHPYFDVYMKNSDYSLRGGIGYLFAMLPVGINVYIDDINNFNNYDTNGVPFYIGGIVYYPYPSVISGYINAGILNDYNNGINWNNSFLFELGGEYTFPSGISLRAYTGMIKGNTSLYFIGIGIGGWATLDIFTLN